MAFSILVFDVSKRSSFDLLIDYIEAFNGYLSNNENRIMIILGNKCDKESREVSFEEA